ncbi:MAG TPA: hypothetical protein VEC11_02630 [Allosphingosinicella sp.]|nr:hypothetical protein [Allosphingosinicella sp.]
MRNTPYLAAAASAALLALAGCNNDPVQINTVERDTNAPTTQLNATDLPPSITANKIYRCSDNSLFYVTFYSDNSAMLRRGSSSAEGTRLEGAAGGPFTAEGQSVSGSGDNVTINGKSCHT